MAGKPADPAKPPEPAQPAADQETGRITTIEDLSARQDRTESKLDQILGLLGSSSKDQAPAAAGDGSAAAPGFGMNEIKQAIRDVGAEQQQKEADAAHAAEHDRLRGAQQQQKEPEHTPRDAMIRGKERLQKVLFGGEK